MRRWPRFSEGALPASVIALSVVGFGALSEWRGTAHSGAAIWIPDLAVGLGLAAEGLTVRVIGRQSRLGWIVLAAGLFWYAGNFAGSGGFGELAYRGSFVHRAVLFHAMMAFPVGRLTGLSNRAIVALAYIFAIVGPGSSPSTSVAWAFGIVLAYVVSAVTAPAAERSVRLRVAPAVLSLAIAVGGTAMVLSSIGTGAARRLVVGVYQGGIVLAGLAIVLASVDRRLSTQAVTDAVLELTLGPNAAVRELLAEALHDPSVVVAFATGGPPRQEWVDEVGRPIRLVGDVPGRSIVSVEVDGHEVARLSCDASIAKEPQLLAAVSKAAGLASFNARLQAELRADAEDLTRSRQRLISAADDERLLLGRQLERGAGASARDLRILLDRLSSIDNPALLEIGRRAQNRLDGLVADLASLASGLGPFSLSAGGLAQALVDLSQQFELAIELNVELRELPVPVATTGYFVCAEALTNVVKHANATAVVVTARQPDDRLELVIVDNGRGGASTVGRGGLASMADRVLGSRGSLAIDSRPGHGTLISVSIPLHPPM